MTVAARTYINESWKDDQNLAQKFADELYRNNVSFTIHAKLRHPEKTMVIAITGSSKSIVVASGVAVVKDASSVIFGLRDMSTSNIKKIVKVAMVK